MDTGLSVETLPLFRSASRGLEQIVRVRWEPAADGVPVRVELRAPGWTRTVSAKRPTGSLDIAVPALDAATACDAALVSGERRVERRVTLPPRRRWEIHVQNFTHTDIGYTDLPSRVARGYRGALRSILQYCDETDELPDDSRYRWNVETGYWLECAVTGLTAAERARLRSLIRKGRVELTPLYVAHTSEFNDEETLIRSMYYAFEYARGCGAAIRTAMASDSTGQPWLFPQIFARSGVRYFSTAVNATMGKAPKLPRPFFWQSRDGSRILVLDTDERQAYQEGVMVGLTENLRTMERKLPAYLLDLEENGGYPFGLLALRAPGYPGDNTQPNIEVSRNVQRWNERWAFPRLRMSTYTPFFEELERRHGSDIPTVSGAWPDWWVLYHGATAFETGVNRCTHADLVAAERLATMLKTMHGSTYDYPREELRDAYRTMLLADEADWGAYSSVTEPDSLQTRGQRAEEQVFVFQVAINAKELAEKAMGRLARSAAHRRANGILVANTSGWNRSEVVTVSIPEKLLGKGGGVRVIDAETGAPVDSQVVEIQRERPAVRIAFRADGVPALGFRTYDFEPFPAEPPEEIRDGRCSNDHYEVAWDPSTGTIDAIRERGSSRNLLDERSPHRWGQLIYETPEQPRSISLRDHMGLPDDLVFLQPYYRSLHDFYDYPRAGARLRHSSPVDQRVVGASRGRIFTEIASQSSMELFPRITCRLVLDNCFKRLIVIVDIDRIETLEAEGVFVAFPFLAERPLVRVACHGGWFQPEREQLPGSSKDWYCVQKWLDVESDGFHVTWSPLEAPLVQLGALTTGRWLDEILIDNGTIYSYVMNNYWWTNSPASQGGRFRFRYALTSGTGPCDPEAASRFGHDFHLPLSASIFEAEGKAGRHAAGSLLEGELPANVALIGMKQEEGGDAIVLRFLETGGRPTTFPISLRGKRIHHASVVSPVEEAIRPLKAGSTGVPVTLGPFELQTVRFGT